MLRKNEMNINGVKISVPQGANVSIINGKVFVNGEPYENAELDNKRVVNIYIDGDVGNINCGGSVTAQNVHGDVDCGGSCCCGNISGSVDAGGSVSCGNVQGDVDAGGSIRINR